jgi:hypothetical protein
MTPYPAGPTGLAAILLTLAVGLVVQDAAAPSPRAAIPLADAPPAEVTTLPTFWGFP